MSDNVLRVLDIARREDIITNLLAYVATEDPEFRQSLLNPLGLEALAPKTWEIVRRPQTGKGVPDLVLTHAGRSPRIVILENKVTAEETGDQTARYATPDCVSDLAERFGLEPEAVEPHFLYLTLMPTDEPQSERFTSVSYRTLLSDHISGASSSNSSLADRLSKDLVDVFENFYLQAEPAPNDFVTDKMHNETGLGAGYLYFQNLFTEDRGGLSLPPGLRVIGFNRSSHSGRRYYLARLNKSHWRPGGIEKASGDWNFDPHKDYHLHFEPQYDVLSGELTLYVHYETDPYHPQSTLKSNLSEEALRVHDERKQSLTEALEAHDLSNFRVYHNYDLQIAKAEVEFTELTLRETASQLSRLFREGCQALDDALTSIEQP